MGRGIVEGSLRTAASAGDETSPPLSELSAVTTAGDGTFPPRSELLLANLVCAEWSCAISLFMRTSVNEGE